MDFFSNGFQQLFADLENDIQENLCEKQYNIFDMQYNNFHDIYDYQLNNTTTTTRATTKTANDQIEILFENDKFNDYNDQLALNVESEFQSITKAMPKHEFTPVTEETMFLTTNNNDTILKYETNYQQFINEQNYFTPTFEFDWENQFLDNYIELPDFVNLLPEKTPLCNDSCDLFLKESSENLNKFRQTNNVTNTKNNCDNNNNNKNNKVKIKLNNNKNYNKNNENNINKNERKEKLENSLPESINNIHNNKNDNNNCIIKITFPCTWESCEKVYAKPAHLRAHLRRHLGDKPYICNWPNCTWRFSRSDELARHKRSHSGVKPFKCIYCPKCFARSDHLAKHRKVHERKMAASKLKGVYIPNLHQVRPGRKPKNSQYY